MPPGSIRRFDIYVHCTVAEQQMIIFTEVSFNLTYCSPQIIVVQCMYFSKKLNKMQLVYLTLFPVVVVNI